jgi:hypothetical protein
VKQSRSTSSSYGSYWMQKAINSLTSAPARSYRPSTAAHHANSSIVKSQYDVEQIKMLRTVCIFLFSWALIYC